MHNKRSKMKNNKLSQISNSQKISDIDLRILKDIEKKVSWLSAWMIHNANNIRPSLDGIKVGGHQASSASIISIMVALYFKILKSEDRVAVKPHAAPVFHSIQYLLGNQNKDKLENFRAFGGAQSYPSRTKDTDDVDYSTGSVGLGGAITIFGSLIQDYVTQHNFVSKNFKPGKIISSGYKTTQYNIPLYRKFRPKKKSINAENFLKTSFFLDIHRWRTQAEIDEELRILDKTSQQIR